MTARDQKISEEAAALWLQLYREPPPPETDGRVLLQMILQGLPHTSYGRLVTPHLRPAAVVFPER